MHDFWAMDGADKIWTLIKYGTVGLFILSFGFAVIVIVGLAIDIAKDRIRQWQYNRQKDWYLNQPAFTPQDDPQVAIFELRQIRRQRQDELKEFYRNVQEIRNDPR